MKTKRAGHRLAITLHAKLQHVLDSSVINLDVELDRASFDALCADNRTPRSQRCAQELRVNHVQVRIAVRAINNCVESSIERNRISADVYTKIRRVGRSLYRDAIELTVEGAR